MAYYVPAIRGGALPIVQPDNVDSLIEMLRFFNKESKRSTVVPKGVTIHGDTHLQEEQFCRHDKNTFVEAMGG